MVPSPSLKPVEVERRCAGCRVKRPKRLLIRFTRTRSGEALLDRTMSMPGRGGYICRDIACFESSIIRGSLGRTLRAQVSNTQASLLRQQVVEYLLHRDVQNESS